MKTTIQELMNQCGVAFGTSGARGLASAMTDQVCYLYTQGFLQSLWSEGQPKQSTARRVAVAGDLRPSTNRIMNSVCQAVADAGFQPLHCGQIPSPALALFGFQNHLPSIMVTGSHIPDDRNGIKFNKPEGELLKSDEPGILRQVVGVDEALFDDHGFFKKPLFPAWPEYPQAGERYKKRYWDFFGADALQGMRLAVYQHSAVGRDFLADILQGLGAQVTPLGRSDTFIPVDTEAIRPEDVELARKYAADGSFDAVVSTDGDSDRPLISDERGVWLRGDVAGILCARFLDADSISTPVSCNSAVELCQWFPEVRRTRIGSPYVVASMQEASAAGRKRVVGYEANGGFLLNSPLGPVSCSLAPLPTRDAVLPILGVLLLAKKNAVKISELSQWLPPRFTASDRLQRFPISRSAEILQRFNSGNEANDRKAMDEFFAGLSGQVQHINRTDGLRMTFANGEIVHLRPSGNAPELRCYAEAGTEDRANRLVMEVLKRILA